MVRRELKPLSLFNVPTAFSNWRNVVQFLLRLISQKTASRFTGSSDGSPEEDIVKLSYQESQEARTGIFLEGCGCIRVQS